MNPRQAHEILLQFVMRSPIRRVADAVTLVNALNVINDVVNAPPPAKAPESPPDGPEVPESIQSRNGVAFPSTERK